MNTDEREERLKQIRERKDALGLRHGDWPCQTVHNKRERAFQQYVLEDIDFLLSLLDSQAPGRNREAERVAMEGTKEGLRQRDERTATRMRDKCVEAIKAALADERRKWPNGNATSDYEQGQRFAFTYAISAIESLTLDSTEQKEEQES